MHACGGACVSEACRHEQRVLPRTAGSGALDSLCSPCGCCPQKPFIPPRMREPLAAESSIIRDLRQNTHLPCETHVPTFPWHYASCCASQLIGINKDGCVVTSSHGVTPRSASDVATADAFAGKLEPRCSSSVIRHFYVKLNYFQLNLRRL